MNSFTIDMFDDLKGRPTTAKWDALMDRLGQRLKFRGGLGVLVRSTEKGTVVSARKSRRGGAIGGATAGPFCKVFKNEAGTSWMLLGGIVSGGVGNITVPTITLGTVDPLPADGTYFWMNISFTAYTEDDVLLPGGDVTAAVSGSGLALPDNTIPTAAALDGTLYVSLGVWSQGKFIPSGCGDIPVSHCPGSLTATRSTTVVYDYVY